MRRLAALPLAVCALVACASATPREERLRAENELLKAQIEVIKRNCSYYRDVEVEAEDDEGP
jgi:hypothetical protein